MKYADLINSLRYELSDANSTEWDDKDLFEFTKRSERRIRLIVIKNKLEFARKEVAIQTVPGQTNYPLPADFDINNGLYRRDIKRKLVLLNDDEWELAPIQGDVKFWRLKDGEIILKDSPVSEFELGFHYFPLWVRPADINDEMFFQDRLADSIMLYAAFVAKNVDEMSLEIDQAILKDIEMQILEVYNRNQQRVLHLRGNFF